MISSRCRAQTLMGLLVGFAGSLVPACTARGGSPSPARSVDRSDGTLPSLEAKRCPPNTIVLDGELREPFWQTTGTTDALVHPSTGAPEPSSGVQAEARLAWDDTGLYLGMIVHERAPTSTFAPSAEDPHLWESASAIELMLQPGDLGDNRDYYEIQVDIHGAVWDTHFDNYNAPISRGADGVQQFGHQAWRSEVRKAVKVNADKGEYTLELQLPWTVIQQARVSVPPKAGDVWRVNVYSFRQGQQDSLAWSPLLGRGNFHRAERFGRVRFGG